MRKAFPRDALRRMEDAVQTIRLEGAVRERSRSPEGERRVRMLEKYAAEMDTNKVVFRTGERINER